MSLFKNCLLDEERQALTLLHLERQVEELEAKVLQLDSQATEWCQQAGEARADKKELEAELAALKQQREGWVLVPKELTVEMLMTVVPGEGTYSVAWADLMRKSWRAMLAAAPKDSHGR